MDNIPNTKITTTSRPTPTWIYVVSGLLLLAAIAIPVIIALTGKKSNDSHHTHTSKPTPTTGPTPTSGPIPTTGPTPTPTSGPIPTTGPTPTSGPIPTTGPTPAPVDYCNKQHLPGGAGEYGYTCMPKDGDKFRIRCKVRNSDGGGEVTSPTTPHYMTYDSSSGHMACIAKGEGGDNAETVWQLHQCSGDKGKGTNCSSSPGCLSNLYYYIEPQIEVDGQDPNRVVECGSQYCDLTHGNALVKNACDSTWWDLWGYNLAIPKDSLDPDANGQQWFNFVQICNDLEDDCPHTAHGDNNADQPGPHNYINVRTEYDLKAGTGVYGEWIDKSGYALPSKGLFALESIPSTTESYSKEEDAGVY